MSDRLLNLKSPPIVEAVLDVDCDMPPGLDFAGLQTASRDAFRDRYPKVQVQHMQALQVEAGPDRAPNVTTKHGVRAFQFLQEDGKQLVQVRAQGFSFNRLAPYSSLDDYVPEMERTWRLFVGLAAPVEVRVVRLRYINRILLPLTEGRVKLDDYLKFGPQLPGEDKLVLLEFLNQHHAVELETGNHVKIVLAAQPQEDDMLPIILDIESFIPGNGEPNDWAAIHAKIKSLRRLKNRVFWDSLTDQCLDLFQH